MIYFILAIVCVVAYVVFKVISASHKSDITKQVDALITAGRLGKEEKAAEIESWLKSSPALGVPQFVGTILLFASLGFGTAATFNGAFYMQEPRESVFVRDILGKTHVNFDTGWHWLGFGSKTVFKKEMTAAFGAPRAGAAVSYPMPVKSAVFLDNVTADISATVRIVMPTTEKNFRELVEKLGSPENLMASLMIPTIERTIDATTGLMTAEKYFSGGKTEFMNEFDKQMRQGIYVVDVKEVKVHQTKKRKGSQNASKGQEQDAYGDKDKIVYKVVKRMDENNQAILTPQEYAKYGISIASAIIVQMDPNAAFDKRMELKQQASADLAIAREATKKEEAQKALAIAKGEREAAQAQAEELKAQIRSTTKAETEKQLAITKAEKDKASMKIQEDTALIQYRRDKLTAKSIVTLADAAAYEKKATLKANGALELKLSTYEKVMDRMATAIEKRSVPGTLIQMGGAGGAGGDLAGGSSDINQLLQIIAASAAKDLGLDMTMKAGAKVK